MYNIIFCDRFLEDKIQNDNEIENNVCGEENISMCGIVNLESVSHFKTEQERSIQLSAKQCYQKRVSQ